MNTSRRLLRSCTQILRQVHHASVPVSRLGALSGRQSYLKASPTALNRFMSSATAPQKFEVINVQSEEDFQKRVLDVSSSTPIVIDFHATWCGPCKILGPRLESILSENDGKVIMAKVDIDDLSDLAMEYGVSSVPTVMGLRNGKVQGQFVGVQEDDQIRSFVDKLVIS